MNKCIDSALSITYQEGAVSLYKYACQAIDVPVECRTGVYEANMPYCIDQCEDRWEASSNRIGAEARRKSSKKKNI